MGKPRRYWIVDNNAEVYDEDNMLEDALINAKELENRFGKELYIVDSHSGKRIKISEGRKALDEMYKNTVLTGRY
jgi:hypothetical protein